MTFFNIYNFLFYFCFFPFLLRHAISHIDPLQNKYLNPKNYYANKINIPIHMTVFG